MKREVYTCDRCEKEISDVVYTLTCYADDINPAPFGSTSDVTVQNLRQNMAEMSSGGKRHLCKACKDELTDGLFIV